MKTLFKIVSGISLLSFPIAITYMVEPNIHYKSLDTFALYAISLLIFLALGSGMFDKNILRFIKTEEERMCLVRVGVGGLVFSLVFICILALRM